MPEEKGALEEILSMEQWAVFGASDDLKSDGYRIVHILTKKKYDVYPINPRIAYIDKRRCYGTLGELRIIPQVAVIALPPDYTLDVLDAASRHGLRRFWIEPGCESDEARTYVGERGLMAVFNTSLLKQLGSRS